MQRDAGLLRHHGAQRLQLIAPRALRGEQLPHLLAHLHATRPRIMKAQQVPEAAAQQAC